MGWLTSALQQPVVRDEAKKAVEVSTPVPPPPPIQLVEDFNEATSVHKILVDNHLTELQGKQIRAVALAFEGLTARLVAAGVLSPDDARAELAPLREVMRASLDGSEPTEPASQRS